MDVLTEHGLSEAVIDTVGEGVLGTHRDAATLSQIVTLLLGIHDVDPETALQLQQREANVRRILVSASVSCAQPLRVCAYGDDRLGRLGPQRQVSIRLSTSCVQ